MLIDNAAGLVESLLPSLTNARRKEAYIRGAQLYASRGWTNIHSMSVNPVDIPLLNGLAREGKLKIRVYNSIDLLPNKSTQTFSLFGDVDKLENSLVTTRAIKLYADGALGSRGAALLAPYSDDEKNSGLLLLKKKRADSIFDAALRTGTQINTHAIGDRANRMILDWYEDAFNLGKDRLSGAYAWRALIDSGAIIAGGSDAPVEVGDPRIEFYAATQRKDLKGFSNEDWNPEQKVTPQEALKMFTAWPAYAAFQDTMIGTIEVGKTADLSIFGRESS